jgi:soluble lytic murein transglycosylase-like protein
VKRTTIWTLGFLALAGLPRGAHADYAVLKTGQRLHITGYERMGGKIRLAITGGTVDVASEDLLAVEPEDTFPAAPAAAGPQVAFAALIHQAALKHGVDENLVAKVIAAESNFNPKAVSRRQAQGLMQLMPRTAAHLSVQNTFDPAQNIEAGTLYLRKMLDRFGGNLPLALAAYNAGPESVEKYGGIPPFAETQEYVKRITRALEKTGD